MQNQYFNRRPTISVLNTQKADRSRLTAIEYIKETVSFGKSRRTAIICECECGKRLTISVFHFKNGGIRSYLKMRLDKGRSADDIEKEYIASTDSRLNKFK